MYQVAIVSVEGDLHALAIHHQLNLMPDVECHLIESDRVCNQSSITWSSDGQCSVRAGRSLINPCELDVIWWRRINWPQVLPDGLDNPAEIDLVNNDCKIALTGALITSFRGTWVNHPATTSGAENKLVQLQRARQAGLRVPKTLVSQDPGEIRSFCRSAPNGAVIKPVRGTRQAPLLTQKVIAEHLKAEESLRLCPAIYQEYVPGIQHLRVICFGYSDYAVRLESREVDWRSNLAMVSSVCQIEEDLRKRLRNVLSALDIKMGVFDLKLDTEGAPVFLEVNPQGQFLFLEGMTGIDLTCSFAQFLRTEACKVKAIEVV